MRATRAGPTSATGEQASSPGDLASAALSEADVQVGPEPGSLRVVAYNFLSGGSAARVGHWPRVRRILAADIVLAQECRPPALAPGPRPAPGRTTPCCGPRPPTAAGAAP